MHNLFLKNESDLIQLGETFAKIFRAPLVIFLQGELGAGKTTLVRSFVHASGYKDKVKSPTYNLVLDYVINGIQISHFDFYRLFNPSELDYLGFEEYFSENSIVWIEWPEKALEKLPRPDLIFYFHIEGTGRRLEMKAETERGKNFLDAYEHFIS